MEHARKARALVKDLGVRAHILTVEERLPSSDVEAAARDARYRLMGAWLARMGLKGLYVGHTRDDQAETFLLRVARGSGLDGLAAMRPLSPYPVPEYRGLFLVRPMLALGRDEIRAYLASLGQAWLEDPMNRDPRFSRVRIRESWPHLESLGLTKDRLASTADHLSRAREALDSVTLAILARSSRIEDGIALVEQAALSQAPRELGLRALAALLMAVPVLLGSLARIPMGMLADRFGGIRALLGTYAIATVCIGAVGFHLSSSVAALALFVSAMLGLGAGNGAVFQLVPQRFAKEIGVMTGLVGMAGGIGGFLLTAGLGAIKQSTGDYQLALWLFASLGLIAWFGLYGVKRRWRTTWGSAAFSAARV